MLFERPKGGEQAILVHLRLQNSETSADEQEFKELALSAGAEILHFIRCSRTAVDPKYFIGKGKVEEISQLVNADDVKLVIFDHELSPGQEKNLEKAFQCRVLGRTGLILDIFAQRARTFEGKLQVELAQLQHLSTRLIRGWTHLERQKGGIGLRGPGETQLEVDRRLIRDRVKHIKKRLEKVKSSREQGRRSRQKSHLPTIALVGYTNAGKSSLFSKITGSRVLIADKLFATLDPTLRAAEVPVVGKVVYADTVGFVKDLPHDLVDAFKATLEETISAELLLHVIDVNDPQKIEHVSQVNKVLKEIGASHIPVLEVYNKIDLLDKSVSKAKAQLDIEGNAIRVWVSALNGDGLDLLEESIADRLGKDIFSGILKLPPNFSQVRAMLFEANAVNSEKIDEEGYFILDVRIPKFRWEQISNQFDNLDKFLT